MSNNFERTCIQSIGSVFLNFKHFIPRNRKHRFSLPHRPLIIGKTPTRAWSGEERGAMSMHIYMWFKDIATYIQDLKRHMSTSVISRCYHKDGVDRGAKGRAWVSMSGGSAAEGDVTLTKEEKLNTRLKQNQNGARKRAQGQKDTTVQNLVS